MKIGRLEIIYLTTGIEGADKDSKVAIGWALRKFYLTIWIRIRPNFFRHFICGVHLETKRFLIGISK
jgi:hypothetical protein